MEFMRQKKKPSAFFVVSFLVGSVFESRRGNMPSVPQIKMFHKP
jgi:hypothetical protein